MHMMHKRMVRVPVILGIEIIRTPNQFARARNMDKTHRSAVHFSIPRDVAPAAAPKRGEEWPAAIRRIAEVQSDDRRRRCGTLRKSAKVRVGRILAQASSATAGVICGTSSAQIAACVRAHKHAEVVAIIVVAIRGTAAKQRHGALEVVGL
jgi:hypothetical protein